MSDRNLYQQAAVQALAPDAMIFIDQGDGKGRKRNIDLKSIDLNTGETSTVPVDFMNFVESISIQKGIDSVPGSASISVKAPRHMAHNAYGSIKDALSTMQEVEIYMKGRFLYKGQPQYYPVFWGVISNLTEGTTAGDLAAVTITCQDMMRWLAVTKVNVSPSVLSSRLPFDPTGQVSTKQQDPSLQVHPFSSYFVNLSTPGIIRELFNASTSTAFLASRNVTSRGSLEVDNAEPLLVDNLAPEESQLIEMWQKKFNVLSSALFVYGYQSETAKPSAPFGIPDMVLNTDAYALIYGYKNEIVDARDAKGNIIEGEVDTVKKPLIDMTKLFPQDAAAFSTQTPQIMASNFQNRLDIANEVKNQIHFEFFQDVDGTIVLKPQFYNMDTRENQVYVIEDIDITNFNVIEDESQIITRVDVMGTFVTGMTGGTAESAQPQYGFAVDYDKMAKYGLRDMSLNTNFITTAEDAVLYAQRELARKNSLVHNGSITIQGRPELKLGYPVFIPSRDAFYYVTGITHSFTFGGSFDTTLSVTAFRTSKKDNLGTVLKNLLIETDGSSPTQLSEEGKDTKHDEDNVLNNIAKLCDPDSGFNAERPNYRFKALDDILQYQGTFRYIKGETRTEYDPRKYQQVTDSEGYTLVGNGYPFGKDLKLTEDFRIVDKTASDDKKGNIASTMKIKDAAGNPQDTLSYQQPLTLEQIQNIEVMTAPSEIAINMKPTQDSNNRDS